MKQKKCCLKYTYIHFICIQFFSVVNICIGNGLFHLHCETYHNAFVVQSAPTIQNHSNRSLILEYRPNFVRNTLFAFLYWSRNCFFLRRIFFLSLCGLVGDQNTVKLAGNREYIKPGSHLNDCYLFDRWNNW